MTAVVLKTALLITVLAVIAARLCFALLLRSKGSVEYGGW